MASRKRSAAPFQLLRVVRELDQGLPVEVGVVGLDVIGVFLLDGLLLPWAEVQVQGLGDFQGRFFLNRKNVLQFLIEFIRPEVKTSRSVN